MRCVCHSCVCDVYMSVRLSVCLHECMLLQAMVVRTFPFWVYHLDLFKLAGQHKAMMPMSLPPLI